MSPVMAARWLFVCSLVTLVFDLGGGRAYADRRPVAVVNLDLTGSAGAIDLAKRLSPELEQHVELRTVPDPGDIGALYEPIDDADRSHVDVAGRSKLIAEEELTKFNNAEAIRRAEEGQRELLVVTPSVAVKLYADLAYVHGLALVAEQRHAEAEAVFAQTHRLDPSRTVDAAREVPEVVKAWEGALRPAGAVGALDVRGTGNVWIDGVEVGTAPGTFTAAPGRHVVWWTGVDRVTGGLAVEVTSGAATVADVPVVEAQRRTKVQRARQALARALDSTARAAAMKRLADLVGVKDAVLLSVAGGKVVVQTWRAGDVERAPGFSALAERGTRRPLELLAPLAPPKARPVDDPPVVVPPLVATKWYDRRAVQLGIVGGIAALIVGGYFLSQVGPDTVTPMTNIGFFDAATIGKR